MATGQMAMTLTCTDDAGEVKISGERLLLDENAQKLLLGSTLTVTDMATGEQRDLLVTNISFNFVAD